MHFILQYVPSIDLWANLSEMSHVMGSPYSESRISRDLWRFVEIDKILFVFKPTRKHKRKVSPNNF
jgi:hypothetical protein